MYTDTFSVCIDLYLDCQAPECRKAVNRKQTLRCLDEKLSVFHISFIDQNEMCNEVVSHFQSVFTNHLDK